MYRVIIKYVNQGFPQSMLSELKSMLRELTSLAIDVAYGFWSNFKNS